MGKVSSTLSQALGSSHNPVSSSNKWQKLIEPSFNKIKAIYLMEYSVQKQMTSHSQLQILIERQENQKERLFDFNIARLSFANNGMLIEILAANLKVEDGKKFLSGELFKIYEDAQIAIFQKLGLIVKKYESSVYNLLTLSCKTFVDSVRTMLNQQNKTSRVIATNDKQSDILFTELEKQSKKPVQITKKEKKQRETLDKKEETVDKKRKMKEEIKQPLLDGEDKPSKEEYIPGVSPI